MITPNRHYSLPNKNHDVMDDINALRSTFGKIDGDIKTNENQIEELEETVSDLENRVIHFPNEVENSEIQNFAANRYLVVNQNGDGIECLEGGGDAGGKLGQSSIKKSDKNFDTAWGNILNISKNGVTIQENSETSQGNETHIFADETEIKNDEQLPKAELTNCRAKSDLGPESNSSVIFCDEIEEVEDEPQIATNLNYGFIKVGNGLSIDDGIISAPIITKATEDNTGIIKTGDGLINENGKISRAEIDSATFFNFGVIKLGENLSINSNGEMEIDEMANATTIYNLGNVKICNDGIVELEEKTLVYRLFVAEDLVIQFKMGFEPRADFSFVLELVSDGTHLVAFNENLNPKMNTLPINRGTTKIKFTKKQGIPSYDFEISRLDAPNPILLTPSISSYISSEFCITAPKGGSWTANSLLRTSYNGYCDINELNFKFETLVCVDYVNYLSRSSSAAMGEFILKGSNDGKNWTTLIYKNGEIVYGKIYTELKGCFRYFNLKIGYTSDDNRPGAVTLWGTQIDNNESELTILTPYMSSNTTAFATLTTSNDIVEGSAGNITDEVGNNNWLIIKRTGDDWIKFEFPTAQVANLLELHYGPAGTSYGYYGERQANWFRLFGSNDDENWTLLLERQYQGASLEKSNYVLFFPLDNTTAYKYYKYVCVSTNNSDTKWDIRGFRLYRRDVGKHNFYRGVPKLASANQDGYEITASSQCDNGHAGYLAFDDNTQTRWASSENEGNSWLQVKLPTAMAYNAVKIAPRGDGYIDQAPSAFQIQGSNDGENWDVLDSETNVSWATLGELRLFQFENETTYLYYRLYITANQGSAYNGCSCFILGNVLYEYKRYLDKYDYSVPQMSSNSQNGYVTSADSTYGSNYPAWKAFDRSNSSSWTSADATSTTPHWLKIYNDSGISANCINIRWHSEHYGIDYVISGSNDDKTYTDLVTVADNNNINPSYSLSNTQTFKYWKIYITRINPNKTRTEIHQFNLINSTLITEY